MREKTPAGFAALSGSPEEARLALAQDRKADAGGHPVSHHPTANGTMKFLTLADWTGFLEVSLFAQVYRDYGHLTVHPVVAVEATVDPFDNHQGFALNGRCVLKLHA